MTGNPWGLNQREHDVILLVSEGKLIKQIADLIGLAEPTVKGYVKSAKKKMRALTLPHAAVMIDRDQRIQPHPLTGTLHMLKATA